MRKFAKFLMPALLVAAIVVSCVMMFASAAGTPKVETGEVVYIANVAKGTGDGSSAENAMGHSSAYDITASKAHGNHAFYRALVANDNALIKNGGVIVIVDELSIDYGDGRRASFSEFQWPGLAGTKNITITSYYDGVDYRATGAKLVLDTTQYGINWRIKAPSTWEYLNIEAKYNSSRDYGKSVDSVAMISFYGNKTVIDEEVNVTSNDIAGATEFYPALTAYDRMGTNANTVTTASTDLTINSGKWQRVYGSNYGMRTGGGDEYGSMKGDVNVTVNGGYVGIIFGTTQINTNFTFSVEGNVNINLNGGKVVDVYASNHLGVTGEGSKINVNVDKDVTGLNMVTAYYSTGSNAANAPKDATITHDRSNLSEDKVTHFTTKNVTGEEVLPPVASDVVYISANGTGDGSSPESPLGNDPTYYTVLSDPVETVRNTAYKLNAFYRAFQALSSNGGTIVMVGDVVIDSCASRMPTAEGQKKSPSEFLVPKAGGEVVITSVYGGVDYRANAKLVLDLDKCNTTFLEFKNAVTFEKLNIQHKYDPNDFSGWGNSFAFSAFLNRLVIGAEVNVTSLNADTNAAGDRFPIILGANRYQNLAGNANVTVNSGTWDMVIGGSYGMSGNYGKITGNAKIVVNGGKIGKIYVTGGEQYSSGSISGTGTLTVNGGEVERIYFSNKFEYLGTGSVVTLGAGAKVSFIDYAVKGYNGNLEDLKTRVTIINNIEGLEIGVEPPREPDVIYVSDNGTGDGSSPDKPLGTDPGNVVASDSHTGTAFYKAMNKLTEYGGYIVIVGDTAINSAESRVEGTNQSPSELPLPKLGGELIVTSVYNGVDYRANAKLILDQDACSVAFVTFKSDVRFENLNILHKYDLGDTNAWGTPMVLAANGNKLVVDKGVNVTAWDAAKNVEGNWYPAIIGGHRYVKVNGDTNVTIKSGNWDFVNAGSFGMTTTYPGIVTGNATLKVEGGKIGSIYGTSSQSRPYGSVNGVLTIDVTGGYVDVINVAAKNGAQNPIYVNVAATADRVTKIVGAPTEASMPANLVLVYDRSVTRDDEVKNVYPENLVILGDASQQPEPVFYTLYVANKEKGRGDGSAPEHAIGHDSDYYSVRAKALSIIAANGGTNSNLQGENKTIVGSVYKKNALYKALSKMASRGGIIVVCDRLSVDATDAMRKSLADFWGASGSENITITSLANGVDYRWKGARLVLDTADLGLCLELDTPTTFDHITIEHRYNSKNGKSIDNGAIIAARGNKLTIGYDVAVIANDVNPDTEKRIEMYPSICGGHRYSDSKADCYVTVGSGTWAAVVGGDWGKNHTGNATIAIDGSAKIGTVCGTIKPTASGAKNIFDGSVWIGLWGGEVDNVYVVAKPGLKWGDASIGLGGTKINGVVRATHPDYSGEEIQSWVFNYSNEQIDKDKVIGFEEPVPATGSPIVYLGVVAVVALLGTVALIATKKRKIKE